MKKYRHIVFDLDGTLTDSEEGIINAVQYALERFGIDETDRTKLRTFIGPPLVHSLKELYDFGHEQIQKAATYYREYFSEKGIFENKVYPGIPELLDTLISRGKTLHLATGKRTDFAERVVDYFKLNEYFDTVVGGSPDGIRIEKPDIIRHLFTLIGDERRGDSVMIGDRKHDIHGAHENNVDSVGVLYGYGTEEEIRKAAPRYIVNTVDELATLLETV
jgi:phosphoglycolate phosphatase